MHEASSIIFPVDEIIWAIMHTVTKLYTQIHIDKWMVFVLQEMIERVIPTSCCIIIAMPRHGAVAAYPSIPQLAPQEFLTIQYGSPLSVVL